MGAAESRDRAFAGFIFVGGKLQVLVSEHREAV